MTTTALDIIQPAGSGLTVLPRRSRQVHRLIELGLADEAEALLAPATVAAYARDWMSWRRWCIDHGEPWLPTQVDADAAANIAAHANDPAMVSAILATHAAETMHAWIVDHGERAPVEHDPDLAAAGEPAGPRWKPTTRARRVTAVGVLIGGGAAQGHSATSAAGARRAVAAQLEAAGEREAAAELLALGDTAWPSPAQHPRVRALLARYAERHNRTADTPRRKAAALTVEDLRLVLAALPDDTLAGVRDRALISVGVFAGRRSAELAAMRHRDLEWDAAGVWVTVPRSKTDQQGRGQRFRLRRTGDDLCPVAALERWLAAAWGAVDPPADAAVWQRVRELRRACLLGPLSPKGISAVVQSATERAAQQHPALRGRQFSSHSLRRGFVTSAIRSGASPQQVMAQTGHRSITTVTGYFEQTGSDSENAVTVIVDRLAKARTESEVIAATA